MMNGLVEQQHISSEVVDDDFVQATALWKVLGTQPGQQENFVSNVAGLLKSAVPEVQMKTIGRLEFRVDECSS